MSTKVEATIEDLYKVEGKAELVNGEIVEMPLTGGLPHLVARQITISLAAYERKIRNGYAIGDSAAFVVNLPHRKSFSPDAAFYVGAVTMKFFQGAPVFAVAERPTHSPTAKRTSPRRAGCFWRKSSSAHTSVACQSRVLRITSSKEIAF